MAHFAKRWGGEGVVAKDFPGAGNAALAAPGFGLAAGLRSRRADAWCNAGTAPTKAITAMALLFASAAATLGSPKAPEYVKVCSLYGDGFYYIPGTDTCIKLGGWVRTEVNFGTSGGGIRIGTDWPNDSPNMSSSNSWYPLTTYSSVNGGQAPLPESMTLQTEEYFDNAEANGRFAENHHWGLNYHFDDKPSGTTSSGTSTVNVWGHYGQSYLIKPSLSYSIANDYGYDQPYTGGSIGQNGSSSIILDNPYLGINGSNGSTFNIQLQPDKFGGQIAPIVPSGSSTQITPDLGASLYQNYILPNPLPFTRTTLVTEDGPNAPDIQNLPNNDPAQSVQPAPWGAELRAAVDLHMELPAATIELATARSGSSRR